MIYYRSFREDLYGLYGLARVTGSEPYDVRDLVPCVLGLDLNSMYTDPAEHITTAAIGSTVDDLDDLDDLDNLSDMWKVLDMLLVNNHHVVI